MTQASYELPPAIGPQLLTEMAQTLSLQVTKQSPTHITLEGREDAVEAFGFCGPLKYDPVWQQLRDR